MRGVYVSKCQQMWTYVSIRQHTSSYVSIHQNTHTTTRLKHNTHTHTHTHTPARSSTSGDVWDPLYGLGFASWGRRTDTSPETRSSHTFQTPHTLHVIGSTAISFHLCAKTYNVPLCRLSTRKHIRLFYGGGVEGGHLDFHLQHLHNNSKHVKGTHHPILNHVLQYQQFLSNTVMTLSHTCMCDIWLVVWLGV